MQPRQLHRLADADVGDTLLVVTALGPARGFLKPQEFVEFNALVSTHGVVIQPRADDVTAEVSNDKIVVDAPGRADAVERGARGADAGAVRLRAAARAAVPRACSRSIRRPGASTARRISATGRRSWSRRRPRPSECAAHAGAARSRALLPGARTDRGSQGRARRRGARRAARPRTARPLLLRAVANVMLGRGADAMKDLSQPVASPTAATRRCGARSRWRSRANGPRRAKASVRSTPRPRRCRSNCSATPSRKRCARRSKCATSARRRACSTNSRRSGRRRQRDADLARAQGPHHGGARAARRGADASIARRRNRRTARRRRAGGCARSRCASRSAR